VDGVKGWSEMGVEEGFEERIEESMGEVLSSMRMQHAVVSIEVRDRRTKQTDRKHLLYSSALFSSLLLSCDHLLNALC
jgi:hypothetical protein